MNPEINNRIFIVGCPRSGTTLLQSLITAHPEIASFPESYFFQSLKSPWPWGSWLGIASPKAKIRFNNLLREIGQEQKYLPKLSIFQSQYSSAFVKVLDTITRQQNKSIWLEKTPQHLLHVDLIEQQVKDAQFVHIQRNGEDVVASLYDWALKYPDQSWSKLREIDRAIDLWIKYAEASRSHLHKPNHLLVSYEKLVAHPQIALIKICEFLSIDFEPAMLQQHKAASKKVVTKNEPWKAAVSEPISNANGTKFYQLFSAEQRQYITHRLSSASQKNPSKHAKEKLKKLLKYT